MIEAMIYNASKERATELRSATRYAILRTIGALRVLRSVA